MSFRAFVASCLLLLVSSQKDCPAAPAVPGDRRPDPTQLRVIAFNAEWLFSETSTKSPWTPEQALQHLADVAKLVAELKPDILSLEEVEDCSMLQRLADSVKQLGVPGYQPYMIKGTDTATGQNVGLITLVDPIVSLTRSSNRQNFPIPGSGCKYTGNEGTSAVSKHYSTQFYVNGQRLAMVGAHLVAFPTDPSRCVQREAQASVLRGLVDEALQNGLQVIMLGDLNDYSDRVPDYQNSKPTSRVMSILRDGQPGNSSNSPSLVEVCADVPQSERYSSVYNSPPQYTSIDHILMSSSLASRAKFSFYHGYPDYSVSDHWPAIVDIAF